MFWRPKGGVAGEPGFVHFRDVDLRAHSDAFDELAVGPLRC